MLPNPMPVAQQKKSREMYLRPLSSLIRESNPKLFRDGNVFMKEDCIIEFRDTSTTSILTAFLRKNSRLLAQAWSRWTANTVTHDYSKDLRTILSRPLASDELRTELEIEILHKWVIQNAQKEPTNIAQFLGNCNKRSVIIATLQQLRLEAINHGDGIVYQNTLPKAEDGHFTILEGTCETLQFEESSIAFDDLLVALKLKKWDLCRKLLSSAEVISTLQCDSGFGQLATLSGTKRTCSIRACKDSPSPCLLLVVPKAELLDCLSNQKPSASPAGNNRTLDPPASSCTGEETDDETALSVLY